MVLPGSQVTREHLCFSEGNSGGSSTLSTSKAGTQPALSSCRSPLAALGKQMRGTHEMRVRPGARDAGVRSRRIPNPGDITCPSEGVCRGTVCKLQHVQPEPSPGVMLAIDSLCKK